MQNRWDQKLSQHNLGLCHAHDKKDGPRRTPKHVADPAAYKDIYFVEDIIAERMTKSAKNGLCDGKGLAMRMIRGSRLNI